MDFVQYLHKLSLNKTEAKQNAADFISFIKPIVDMVLEGFQNLHYKYNFTIQFDADNLYTTVQKQSYCTCGVHRPYQALQSNLCFLQEGCASASAESCSLSVLSTDAQLVISLTSTGHSVSSSSYNHQVPQLLLVPLQRRIYFCIFIQLKTFSLQ